MYAAISGFAGKRPTDDFYSVSNTQGHALGTQLDAVDPVSGWGEFIYVKSNDAILVGSCCVWDENTTATLCPNTAGQGFPVGFAMVPMAAGTYGWLQIAGLAVYKTNATVAADAKMGLTAAGILGAVAAGKEICNLRNRVAATGTTTATVNTLANSCVLTAPKGYGNFSLGLALTGTSVPAGAVVAALDPDGVRIYMGSAVGTTGDKVATATSFAITLTGTYTGLGVGQIQYPFAQGQVL